MIKLSRTYALVRWGDEIFWKKVDPKDNAKMIEEAKERSRCADIKVLPIYTRQESKDKDKLVEPTEHEVVFGNPFIDKCVAKAQLFLDDPSHVPSLRNAEYSLWFEDRSLTKRCSDFSPEAKTRLFGDKLNRERIFFTKGEFSFLASGVFSVQLSIVLGMRDQFVFEVPPRARMEVVGLAKTLGAYRPTVDLEDKVSWSLSIEQVLRKAAGDALR